LHSGVKCWSRGISMAPVDNIIKSAGLKVTEIRRKMILLLASTDIALSHADIQEELGSGYDKVTIYRNLHTFIKKGVLHQVPNDSRSAKYAFVNPEDKICGAHAHFICEKCGNTYCLEMLQKTKVELPEKFTLHTISIVAEGVCSMCDKNESN